MRMFGISDLRRDVASLRTTIGELRINQGAMQTQLTDSVARLVKLESTSQSDMVALTQFSLHVQNCEKSNTERTATQRSFRREMRGYAVVVVLGMMSALAFILYHGLPAAVLKAVN
jgi:hypothetical protein